MGILGSAGVEVVDAGVVEEKPSGATHGIAVGGGKTNAFVYLYDADTGQNKHESNCA